MVSKESMDEIDDDIEAESFKKVEAALFLSGRFLSLKELVSLTDVNPIILRKILSDVEDKYRNSGIEVVKKDEKWKMDVAEEHVGMVNKLATGKSEFSSGEQETLAIIAYKQPVKQSVIIKIRGNKAYDHIRRFVEAGLLTKKKMGHTAELSLSESFHEYFQLGKGESIESLDFAEEGDDGRGEIVPPTRPREEKDVIAKTDLIDNDSDGSGEQLGEESGMENKVSVQNNDVSDGIEVKEGVKVNDNEVVVEDGVGLGDNVQKKGSSDEDSFSNEKEEEIGEEEG